MIKTWQQRCDEHPDHQQGIVTQQMIQDRMQEEIDELRQALAQLEQKPMAWMFEGIKFDGTKHGPHLIWKPEYMDAMSANMGAIAVPLYTAPPKREWVGLTKDEIDSWELPVSPTVFEFAQFVETKLKEKNT